MDGASLPNCTVWAVGVAPSPPPYSAVPLVQCAGQGACTVLLISHALELGQATRQQGIACGELGLGHSVDLSLGEDLQKLNEASIASILYVYFC